MSTCGRPEGKRRFSTRQVAQPEYVYLLDFLRRMRQTDQLASMHTALQQTEDCFLGGRSTASHTNCASRHSRTKSAGPRVRGSAGLRFRGSSRVSFWSSALWSPSSPKQDGRQPLDLYVHTHNLLTPCALVKLIYFTIQFSSVDLPSE